MKRFGLLFGTFIAGSISMFGQGAKNIQINEVLTNNTANYVDEYGKHPAWIELNNIAYSSYNVRGMYLTNDRSVLNTEMSVPVRISKMFMIPSGDEHTNLTARKHLLLFCNSTPNEGSLYLNLKVDSTKPTWIALYDGNGVNLIDSVTVPAMKQNCSFARQKDGSEKWVIKAPDAVTPGIGNFIQVSESKVAKVKKADPYGFGLTLLAMSVVFFCLALFYAFFRISGIIITYENKIGRVKAIKKINEVSHKAVVMAKDGHSGKGIDKEIYMAVIAMAMKEYEEDVHDIESNVITIIPHETNWNAKGLQVTQNPNI
jgi:hypothetical protein